MSHFSKSPNSKPWKPYHRLFSMGGLRPHAHSLLPYLNRPRGKFVEVGARDGGKESLTLYLEKAMGWEGLLIEPWPHLFHKCRKNRKRSTAVNVAATNRSLADSYLEIIGKPPAVSIRKELSKAAQQTTDDTPLSPPQRRGKQVYYINTDSIDHILERSSFDKDFDLLILNLVGYENAALAGIDFHLYKPTFILVRVSRFTHALPRIPMMYQRVCTSPHDTRTAFILFRYADFGLN